MHVIKGISCSFSGKNLNLEKLLGKNLHGEYKTLRSTQKLGFEFMISN